MRRAVERLESDERVSKARVLRGGGRESDGLILEKTGAHCVSEMCPKRQTQV